MKIEYLTARSSIRRTENEKEISFELQFLALAVALEVVIVGSSHANFFFCRLKSRAWRGAVLLGCSPVINLAAHCWHFSRRSKSLLERIQKD